jgi:hypothetical protein
MCPDPSADFAKEAPQKQAGAPSKGPLMWEPGTIAPDWRSFQPKILTSSEGIHMIISPCDPGWWAKKEVEERMATGFQIKTAAGEFVVFGWTSDSVRRSGANGSSQIIYIVQKSSDMVLAQVKDNAIAFEDGSSFKITKRGRFAGLGQRRYEFHDGRGGQQFRVDGKGRLWLTDSTDRPHVLFLIAADRFLQETDRN